MQPSRNGVGSLVPSERNHFFYGKMMDAGQFDKDQSYFNHQRSLINRFVLGSGVVCGLKLVQDSGTPGMVRLDPGLAIDGLGREIVVSAPFLFDARQLTNDEGVPQGAPIESGTVVISLAYAESRTDLVPVLVPDCNASERCAAGTIREGFSMLVRQATEDVPNPPACGFPQLQSPPDDRPLNEVMHALLCERTQGTGLEVPQDASVRLARVTLQGSSVDSIDAAAGRQLVYGNALLFELIVCLADRVQALSNET
jgi:hypothetical protein